MFGVRTLQKRLPIGWQIRKVDKQEIKDVERPV